MMATIVTVSREGRHPWEVRSRSAYAIRNIKDEEINKSIQ